MIYECLGSQEHSPRAFRFVQIWLLPCAKPMPPPPPRLHLVKALIPVKLVALGLNPTPNLSIMQVTMRHWAYSYGARDAPTKLPSCPVPLGSCVLREWCRSWENLPTDWGVKWHGCWRTKGRRCGHSTASAWCVTMHATKMINGWRRVSEKRIVCEAGSRRVYDIA
jgi:hypothetical protein